MRHFDSHHFIIISTLGLEFIADFLTFRSDKMPKAAAKTKKAEKGARRAKKGKHFPLIRPCQHALGPLMCCLALY